MKRAFFTLTVITILAIGAWGSSSIRYDALDIDARPVVATGTELRGEVDGIRVSEWDTAATADGWVTVQSGNQRVNVLVLNTPAVVGGRLTESETWSSDRIRVVRDDVIVPAGMTLTLESGTIVKFLPGACIVVEAGGTLCCKGAQLADLADDSVGGDTNMDNNDTVPSGEEWWQEERSVGELATVEFLDGARTLFPNRSYSVGLALANLPTPVMDGAKFSGWFTAPEGSGNQITAETLVAKSMTVYAFWQPLSISIEPATASVTPDAGDGSFAVTANEAWAVSTDSEWITLKSDHGENDGSVLFSLAANYSVAPRSGTIRVTLSNGSFCDFTVTQSATQSVMKPRINPGDGTTFSAARQRVSLSCPTAGAEIRYTLDGSDPDEASTLYTGTSFNVFDTVTVKARAYAEGMTPSEIASAYLVRLQTLPEAIDQPLWTVTTGGDASWDVDAETTSDGRSSARSGNITDDEESWLETRVAGAGTLSFRWKVVCEDDPDGEGWDYLAFSIDGMFVEAIDGDSGWRRVSVKVKDDGVHTFQWLFSKDSFTDDENRYEDRAWVDQVTWTPTVTDLDVPVSWIESVKGAVGSAENVANADLDGDGFTTAEEYVMGTDPNDPDSKLTASIEIKDGKPVVTYAPDLKGKRNYILWGRKSLSDSNDQWQPVLHGRESDYNFFRISVEMP